MRADRRSLLTAALCAALAIPAQAADDGMLAPQRFSAALPVAVQTLGTAGGVMPELLWRPFGADSATQLRLAAGALVSPQYLFTPIDLGVRWSWSPLTWLRPQLGLGLENEIFSVDDASPFYRPALYGEFGLGVRPLPAWEFDLLAVPTIAIFGIGLGARVGLTYHFGRD